jgi:hypothetical protein
MSSPNQNNRPIHQKPKHHQRQEEEEPEFEKICCHKNPNNVLQTYTLDRELNHPAYTPRLFDPKQI